MRSLVLAALLAAPASAQYLMVPDWTADKVMLFSEADGSLVNADFIIDGAGVGYNWNSPREAIQVNDEIWVSDQVSDSVTRFTTAGVFIADITGGLDNVRGLAFAGNKVYVSNAGGANGAPGNGIVMFNLDGSSAGSIAVPDPFDVLSYNGQLLIVDIDGDNIGRYDLGVNFISLFHDSDGVNGIDFPEQINMAANGDVLAMGFTAPAGIYRYNPQGQQVAYIPLAGGRGVAELANGNLLYTNGTGVFVYNTSSQTSTQVAAGNAQFISRLVVGPAACGPADLGGIGGEPGFDGALDNNDFVVFIDMFFAQSPLADMGSVGGIPGADNAWNNNDFVVFVDRFFAGC